MKTSLLRFSLFLVAMLTLVFWLALPGPAAARGIQPQIVFQTPTPGADGRILYTVKSGDTCTSLSLMAYLSVDDIRRLNNLTGDCVLVENSQILLGLTTPQAQVTPTAGPSQTPTPLIPTPTPEPGTGDVCVLLYLDTNGNGLRETDELPIPDGQLSLTNRDGSFSKTQTTMIGIDPETEDYAPTCFTNLPEGEYTVSAAIPAGYNPTTELNYTIDIKAGDQARINFGGQPSANTEAGETGNSGDKTPLMGLFGGLLLLGGVGLGVYLKFFRKA